MIIISKNNDRVQVIKTISKQKMILKMRIKYKCCVIFLCLLYTTLQTIAQSPRQTELFTEGWKFYKGDIPDGEKENLDDQSWRSVDLPHDWSIEGPFSKQWASGTGFLPGGIGWYRKTFELDKLNAIKKSLFISMAFIKTVRYG